MKILFSKTDALGDQLLATGNIRSLLDCFPQAHLIWLVRKGSEPIQSLLKGSHLFTPDTNQTPHQEAQRLLKQLPSSPDSSPWLRSTFVVCPFNGYTIPEATDTWQTQVAWWMDFIHALSIDTALIGSPTRNWVDHYMVASSNAKQKIGFEKSVASIPLPRTVIDLLTERHLSPELTAVIPIERQLHEMDRVATLIGTLTGKCEAHKICIDPTPSPTPSSPFTNALLLAPGAGTSDRIYPLSSLAQAVERLLQSEAVTFSRFVILQGPKDQEACTQLQAILQSKSLPFERMEMSPHDLRDALRVIHDARFLICNDSLWVHLASITQTPTVAIWGLGHWKRFLPRQGNITIVHTKMLCMECDWRCCFSERRCITTIPYEALLEASRNRLTHPHNGIQFFEVESPVPVEEVRQAMQAQLRTYAQLIEERDTLIQDLHISNAERHAAIESYLTRIQELESALNSEKNKSLFQHLKDAWQQ